MRMVLFVFLICSGGCALANKLEAGVTFHQLWTRSAIDQHVEYRFSDGVRWRNATARTKWAEHPLYDYRIAPWGSIVVESRLVRDGKVVAQATLKIPSRPDTRFEVESDIRANDPTRACMGCSRPAVSAPISGNSKERFWMWYGWNGISHTVIF